MQCAPDSQLCRRDISDYLIDEGHEFSGLSTRRRRAATVATRRAQSRTARSMGSSSSENVNMPARVAFGHGSPPSRSTRWRTTPVGRPPDRYILASKDDWRWNSRHWDSNPWRSPTRRACHHHQYPQVRLEGYPNGAGAERRWQGWCWNSRRKWCPARRIEANVCPPGRGPRAGAVEQDRTQHVGRGMGDGRKGMSRQ